jgi:hypothetical protein
MRRAGFGWSDRPDDAVPHADRERVVVGALIQEEMALLDNESFDLDLIGFAATELERLLALAAARLDLIAYEKTGRQARLMELDPKYCDVIVQRWQAFSDGAATLDDDGRSYEEIAAARDTAVA